MKNQNTLWESLGRLYPHVRPIVPRLILGLLCALGASLMALRAASRAPVAAAPRPSDAAPASDSGFGSNGSDGN